MAAGEALWGRDTWANWDPRPEYSQAELEAVVSDLHARLERQMQAHDDPLLAEITPPAPDWGG